MEQTIPVEECAKQRLQVLVYAYTLFIKGLMEEGVDRDKVQRASDKAWAFLGKQAAEQLKPILGEQINIEALRQAGTIAETVHGMEVNIKAAENEMKTEFISCPWNDALTALGIPKDWRLCASGHVAFTENMYKGLSPTAEYKLPQNMPDGDQICEGLTSI
jgi:hypothetical protein